MRLVSNLPRFRDESFHYGGPKRFGHHKNAFGFIRLFLASLVIVSHTPELIYGNREYEILTRVFGTLSFGELAVDGFFIVSGFLISASFLTSRNILNYLWKRIIRIYPGFIVSSLLCLIVVAPLGGGGAIFGLDTLRSAVRGMVFLDAPHSQTAFASTYYPSLNGAMWTIPYEFRCYIIAGILGVFGLLRNGWVLLASSVALILLAPSVPSSWLVNLNAYHLHPDILTGDPKQTCLLTGLFLVGASFRAFKSKISINIYFFILSAILLAISLLSYKFVNLGVGIFGTYVIFSLSEILSKTKISEINNKNDISYGVYLYAWPIEKLIISSGVFSSAIIIGVVTWGFSIIAGCASWFFVEKPIMALLRR